MMAAKSHGKSKHLTTAKSHGKTKQWLNKFCHQTLWHDMPHYVSLKQRSLPNQLKEMTWQSITFNGIPADHFAAAWGLFHELPHITPKRIFQMIHPIHPIRACFFENKPSIYIVHPSVDPWDMEPTMPMGKVKEKMEEVELVQTTAIYFQGAMNPEQYPWWSSKTAFGTSTIRQISTGLTLGIHWNFHNRTMDQQWHIASLQLHHQQHQQHQQLHQSCKRHNSTNSDFTTTTYTNCTTHAKTMTSTNSTNATFTKRVVQRTCSCESKASVTWFKRNSTTAHAPTPPNYPPPHATAQLQMLLLQRYSPMDSHILHTNSQPEGRICRANGRVCRTDKQVPTSSKLAIKKQMLSLKSSNSITQSRTSTTKPKRFATDFRKPSRFKMDQVDWTSPKPTIP